MIREFKCRILLAMKRLNLLLFGKRRGNSFEVTLIFGNRKTEEDVYALICEVQIYPMEDEKKLGAISKENKVLLPEGKYRIVIEVNGLHRETMLSLDNDKSIVLQIPQIYSSIPLDLYHYRSTDDFDRAAIHEMSMHLHQETIFDLNTKSQSGILYIYFKYPLSPERLTTRSNLYLELFDSRHNKVYNSLDSPFVCERNCFIYFAYLDEGLYFLKCAYESQTSCATQREIVVWIKPENVTQIFCLVDENGPILSTTKVIISKLLHYFPDPEIALCDVLLNKIQNHDFTLSDQFIRKYLSGGFNGGYTKFLIALIYSKSNNPDHQCLLKLYESLKYHNDLISLPDFQILGLWVKFLNNIEISAEPAIQDPPLLQLSLEILVELSFCFPKLFVKRSYNDFVSERMFMDTPSLTFSSIDDDTMRKIENYRNNLYLIEHMKLTYPSQTDTLLGMPMNQVVDRDHIFSVIHFLENDSVTEDNSWIINYFRDFLKSRESKITLGNLLKRLQIPLVTLVRVLEDHRIYYLPILGQYEDDYGYQYHYVASRLLPMEEATNLTDKKVEMKVRRESVLKELIEYGL